MAALKQALLIALAATALSCRATSEGPRFSAYAPIPEGKARLYVYRPSSSASWESYVRIGVGERELAALGNYAFVTEVLEPGKHQLGGVVDSSVGSYRPFWQTVNLRPGQAMFCQIRGESKGFYETWQIDCSDDADAHSALKMCREEAPLPPPDPNAKKCPKKPSWERARRAAPADECS